MRRLRWLVLLTTACAGKGMHSAAGNDVSGLLCAGVATPGGTTVPVTSESECTGALLSGTSPCESCTFGPDPALTLVVFDGHTSSGCADAPIAPDDTFSFGRVAPYDEYVLNFNGTVAGEGQPSFAGVAFSVCSDDVVIDGYVSVDTID